MRINNMATRQSRQGVDSFPNSHSRPSHKKCAYHPTRYITGFCRRSECMLPVCPTCIPLHAEQHKLTQTSPDYEQFPALVGRIEQLYSEVMKHMEELRERLYDREQFKRQMEGQIRSKLIEHRNHLIREFEISLTQLEEDLIKRMIEDDTAFISDLKAIDKSLTAIGERVQEDRRLLHGEDVLRYIIIHMSKDYESQYRGMAERVEGELFRLSQKSLVVTVDQSEIGRVKSAVGRYMQLQANSPT